MTTVKLDTEKRIVEIGKEKFKVEKPVNDIIMMLIDEVNSLTIIYETLQDNNNIGSA